MKNVRFTIGSLALKRPFETTFGMTIYAINFSLAFTVQAFVSVLLTGLFGCGVSQLKSRL